MSSQLDFSTWSQQHQQRIENALDCHIPAANAVPERLHQAMRYAALGGGKRLRALLVYAAAAFCGAPPERADRVAVAVECVHAYSLIHDDLPCMDDDDFRRGKPACHKQFDQATALLAGDALQTLAFDVLSQPNWHTNSAQQLQMLALLARASGSLGMAGGQAIDLDHVGKAMERDALEHMHQLKTGALIQASVLLGAHCADQVCAAQSLALQQYGQAIGLAFQVVDDILDAEADSATLGKTAGKDALQNKPTYVTLLGLSEAKTCAKQLIHQALAALAPASPAATRADADILPQLALWIAQRAY